jgi:hypothetical protein
MLTVLPLPNPSLLFGNSSAAGTAARSVVVAELALPKDKVNFATTLLMA